MYDKDKVTVIFGKTINKFKKRTEDYEELQGAELGEINDAINFLSSKKSMQDMFNSLVEQLQALKSERLAVLREPVRLTGFGQLASDLDLLVPLEYTDGQYEGLQQALYWHCMRNLIFAGAAEAREYKGFLNFYVSNANAAGMQRAFHELRLVPPELEEANVEFGLNIAYEPLRRYIVAVRPADAGVEKRPEAPKKGQVRREQGDKTSVEKVLQYFSARGQGYTATTKELLDLGLKHHTINYVKTKSGLIESAGYGRYRLTQKGIAELKKRK